MPATSRPPSSARRRPGLTAANRERQMRLLVQPTAADWERWSALITEENLEIEALEFSMPALLADQETAEREAARYRETGRVASVHGAFIDVNPASGDPQFRALSERRCRFSCALAKSLGAEWVTFHSSCFPFLRGGYLDRWAAVCADFYGALAEEYALTICIENSPDLDPGPMAALMRRCGPGVRVCLDFGHANYSRAPLRQWFDAVGDWLYCFHLSDNKGQFDDHLPLGQGTVDWALADRLWRELDRDTPMTFEVGGVEGVRTSLAFLQEGYFGMEK